MAIVHSCHVSKRFGRNEKLSRLLCRIVTLTAQYLGIRQGLHAHVIHRIRLHQVLHIQLIAPADAKVGDSKVKPLCVPVRVDVKGQV